MDRGLTRPPPNRRLRFVNAYRAAIEPLEALGDPRRRAIVEGLRDGERTVGDLAAGLPVSRPAVSQHLGVLKAAGLVLERPQGTRRYYRLDPIGLVRLHGRLDEMWGLDVAGDAGVAPGTSPVGAVPGRPAEPGAPATAPRPRHAVTDDTDGKGGGKKHKKKHGRK
jgi:DNA-binding transcriptional ArsR family regulator